MYLKDENKSVYIHAEDKIVITRITNPITGKTLFSVKNEPGSAGFVTNNVVIDGVKFVCE